MALSRLKRWIFNNSAAALKSNDKDKLRLDLSKVAIIANVKDEDEIREIRFFIAKKESTNISVSCLLYPDIKNLKGDDIIDLKDVKWTGEPKCEKTKAFLGKDYDILYVATKKLGLTLEYVLKATKANIKVGPYTTETAHYLDLSSDTKHNDIKTILLEIDDILKKLLNNG